VETQDARQLGASTQGQKLELEGKLPPPSSFSIFSILFLVAEKTMATMLSSSSSFCLRRRK
jgi:hypothetical protein